MSLPIYQDTNKNLMMLQTNWAIQLDPVIKLPTSQGLILKEVSLVTGTNSISHLLQRNLQGWYIVRQRAAATIYDTQDSNRLSNLTLTLTSSAPVVVDIFVF